MTGSLTTVEFPIVQAENGDWAQYVDEYVPNYSPPPDQLPAIPGLTIIDKQGKFIDYRYGSYTTAQINGIIDWAVRRIDEALGGRQPVSTVLALDRSGSMLSQAPQGGPEPKIQVLKDAVGIFLDVWDSHAVAGDQVGVVDFSNIVTQYEEPATGSKLVPIATSLPTIQSYVDNLLAGGFTCMGGALSLGLDTVAGRGRQHIILFSDGMQNYNPVVAGIGSYQIEILKLDPLNLSNYTYVTDIYGDSGVPPKPGQDLASFGTRIHTIGVGLPGDPWSQLMAAIAQNTNGLHFQTPAPEADLQNFYINDLLESFKGATPQLVKHASGTFSHADCYAQDSCWINSSARWMTVVLSWQGDPDANQLSCNLEAPDGTLVEINSRTRSAPRHRVISMPLPPFHYKRLVPHAGKWRLHITGTAQAPLPYQVFWIVDDSHTHFGIRPIDRLYRVGDTLPFEVKLIQDKRPIPLDRIKLKKVDVVSPAVDFDKFLSGYRVDPAVLRKMKREMKQLEMLSPSEQKLHALSLDKKALSYCMRKVHTSLPMGYEKGKLVAPITFKRAGIHRFDVHVNAADRQGYRIVRTRTLNILVRPSISRRTQRQGTPSLLGAGRGGILPK